MRILGVSLVLATLGLTSRMSPCDRNLARLEGYTIVKAGSLRGTFEGCDFDRLLEFDDGTTVRCASYGYHYSYHPDATVFAKSIDTEGKKVVIAKLMVDGEMYEARLVSLK